MAKGDAEELAAKMYWAAEGYQPGGVIREVDYETQKGGVHPLFEGIKIVDCDTHITEAPDLFTSRAPAKYKDKVPHLQRDPDGVDRWYCQGRNFGSTGGNVIRKDLNKLLGRLAFPTVEESHPGVYDMKERTRLMDDAGIWAQIGFQNSGVTQPGSLRALGDEQLALDIMSIYNDASMEYQEQSGQRVFNTAHVPFWDRDAMLKEARRCIDGGMKGFVLPDMPEHAGAPSFMDDYWTPFIEMCEATGTPINFHINAAMSPADLVWEPMSFNQKLSIIPIMYSLGNAATMGNWMVSGRLDQFPKLKIGLIESGVGWVPFVLEMLEHQFDEMLPERAGVVELRPWEYWRRNFWTSFWFEKIGPQTQLEVVGMDRVMFQTDFPHPTSLYPDVQDHIVRALGDRPKDEAKMVLQDNASTLFNLGL
ncbi:MAG: amidohydrolase family protein [Sphingomonadaceae bacterium]